MKVAVSIVVIVFGVVGGAIASPTAKSALVRRANAGGLGKCPLDCWNEAAGTVDCDPNVDDCLCGQFFDEVASCTGTTCNTGDNLAALDFMEQACN